MASKRRNRLAYRLMTQTEADPPHPPPTRPVNNVVKGGHVARVRDAGKSGTAQRPARECIETSISLYVEQEHGA